MINVLKNRNNKIGYLMIGEIDESCFRVINLRGNEITVNLEQVSELESEPLEIEEDKLPIELVNHLSKYKDALNLKAKIDQDQEYRIIYDFVFNSLTHAELDKKFFGVEISGSWDGWKCGEILRKNEVTARGEGNNYLNWPEDRLSQLSYKLQEVILAVKRGWF